MTPAIPEDVQLAPLHESRCGGRDLLVRARAERRDGHACARGGSAARRRAVAVGVVELLVGDGRDDDRQLDLRPEHGRRRRDRGHVAEDARPERPACEGGAVLAQRPLVAGAAGEVGPRAWLDALLGDPLVVRDGEEPLHATTPRRCGERPRPLPRGTRWAARARPCCAQSPPSRRPSATPCVAPSARRRRGRRSSSGIESRHSSSSASSTPSARASSCIVSSRAALPFVQPA